LQGLTLASKAKGNLSVLTLAKKESASDTCEEVQIENNSEEPETSNDSPSLTSKVKKMYIVEI
jgi:hypothetical protein